jgi:predicted dehydrogenase
MKSFRFAVVGMVHDHVWPVWNEGYIRQLLDNPKVELVAAADVHPELCKRIADEFGVKKTYLDYKKMIEEIKPDAVLMALPNDEKADAVEYLAKRKIHVLMDKAMSASLSQADRMLKAAQTSGIKMLVNWPTAWLPSFHEAHRLVKGGTIGEVYELKARIANPGPENHGCSKYFLEWLFSKEKNGGGALVDYCCYGIVFSLWFMGNPISVSASGGNFVKHNLSVDDNAWVIMNYKFGHAIAEGSWSQYGVDGNEALFPDNQKVIISGTDGTIIFNWFDKSVRVISKQYPKGTELAANALPSQMKDGPTYFIHCLENNERIEGMVSPEVCRDVQEVMELGYKSIETGKTLSFAGVGGKANA